MTMDSNMEEVQSGIYLLTTDAWSLIGLSKTTHSLTINNSFDG